MTKLDLSPEQVVDSLPPSNPVVAALVNGRWVEDKSTMTEKLCCTVNSMGSPTEVTLGQVGMVAPKKHRDAMKQQVFKDAFRRHT